MKWCGKSAPRGWQHSWQGKPHLEQGQIGEQWCDPHRSRVGRARFTSSYQAAGLDSGDRAICAFTDGSPALIERRLGAGKLILATAQLMTGDWRTWERRLDRLRSLTPGDVQRATSRFIVPEERSVVWIRPPRAPDAEGTR